MSKKGVEEHDQEWDILVKGCKAEQANSFRQEAALSKQEARITKAKADDLIRTLKFKNAGDFNSGFFEFGNVNEYNGDTLLSNLRRFSRLNTGKPVTIELNSPGGNIIEGFRIYDELCRIKAEGNHFLTIRVRGMAASMAVPILQAADHREVGASAWVMVHRAAFGAAGKAYDIEDEVEFVKKLEGKIVNILCSRSTKSPKFYFDLFEKRKDIWFDAEEAVEVGLCDAVA